MVVAQGRSQLGAGQRGVRSQFYRCRFVLERSVLIEQLIDPNRQGKSGPIQTMLLKRVG